MKHTNTLSNRAGVYMIVTPEGNYVGFSIDLGRRKYSHCRDLRRNIHKNGRLQRAYDHCGEDACTFVVLKYTDDIGLEKYYITKFGSFNVEFTDNRRLARKESSNVGGRKPRIIIEANGTKYLGYAAAAKAYATKENKIRKAVVLGRKHRGVYWNRVN